MIRDSSVNKTSKLPVGVWIHGGGFYMGSGADQRYNMSAIVENSYKIGIPGNSNLTRATSALTLHSQGNLSSP